MDSYDGLGRGGGLEATREDWDRAYGIGDDRLGTVRIDCWMACDDELDLTRSKARESTRIAAARPGGGNKAKWTLPVAISVLDAMGFEATMAGL